MLFPNKILSNIEFLQRLEQEFWELCLIIAFINILSVHILLAPSINFLKDMFFFLWKQGMIIHIAQWFSDKFLSQVFQPICHNLSPDIISLNLYKINLLSSTSNSLFQQTIIPIFPCPSNKIKNSLTNNNFINPFIKNRRIQKPMNYELNEEQNYRFNYQKHFGIPNRIDKSPNKKGILIVSSDDGHKDYTDKENNFQEGNLLNKFRKDFEFYFMKLMRKCRNIEKYDELVETCENKYGIFSKILTHYEEKSHHHSYTSQLHKNSTNMKLNLLNLLEQAQNQVLLLQKELEKANKKHADELNEKNNQIEQKNNKNMKNLQIISQLQNQKQYFRESEQEKSKFYNQKLQELQKQLMRKNQELKKQKQHKNSIQQEINQLKGQVKTLTLLQNQKKSCIRLKNDKDITKNERSEDLERFLLIQAIGIEQLLSQQ